MSRPIRTDPRGRRAPRPLTTTSFVLLGLLGVRDWTAYELAQQMDRTVRFFWPRAQRKIYEQAKLLVEHGMATGRREPIGRRHRVVYSITARGRDALQGWLAAPSEPPEIEFEALAKAFFGEQGDKGSLLASIRSVGRVHPALLEHVRAVDATTPPGARSFPGRQHVNALTFVLLWSMTDAMRRWSEWAEAWVSGWPDDLALPPDLADEAARLNRGLSAQPPELPF